MNKKIIIIGGGAAGFFAAVNLAARHPEWPITILEKSGKLLSKVRISGGGRCNVTHHCFDNNELIRNYPRGFRELKQVFARFSVADTVSWFREQGVTLRAEEDGRMFPYSNSSQTIIECFLDLARKRNVKIITRCEVFSIQKRNDLFSLQTQLGGFEADALICAAGGHPKTDFYHLVKNLGHTINRPIPSLFTINLPNEQISKVLQGISVKNAEVRVAGTKLSYAGPLIITHWGFSGPAVLKLSAFAAGFFYDCNYTSRIEINWMYPFRRNEVENILKQLQKEKARTLPFSNPVNEIPKRLWEYLCRLSGMDNSRPWAEIGNKQIAQLALNLTTSTFKMEGKTTFKEEFVTSGGVNLKEVDFRNMQSKLVPKLYFCGEVLDIDGVTGGFNFQSAWSTAWICAHSIN